MIRRPAVAGSFYPEEKADLLDQLKQIVPSVEMRKRCLGVISPHAGYIYSGAIAGQLLAETTLPRQIVLLGPNHHGLGADAAIFCDGFWSTPLGEVPIATGLASQLMQSCSMLQSDPLAHRLEHSIEVQLPLLKYLQPNLQIVPICLGHGTLDDWLQLGADIGEALNAWSQEVLVVASSDMNHFLDATETRRRDYLAIDAVLALDPSRLYQTVRENDISMCGVVPAVVMLQSALTRGATECRLNCYGNSGDVNGDMSRVVGYAALSVF
ncbi:MAG TPA: AmmeMemoRadiSam system protein B [Geopsychrobacteraceae bacterium]|nr:AmmeMemoRadiSam system protein B [Geopsychrobacteraceae bacterium]